MAARAHAENRAGNRTRGGRAPFLRLLFSCVVLWAVLLIAPTALAGGGAAEQGRGLYSFNCAHCHGAALEGKRIDSETAIPALVPTPDMPGQVWHFSDPQIFGIVKKGSHTLEAPAETETMPVFGDRLSDQQIYQIIAFVKNRWPQNIRESQQEVSRMMARTSGRNNNERGAEIFARRCAICHGHDLEGKTHKAKLGGEETLVRIPSLATPNWLWKSLEKRVFRIIKFGEKAHPSPSSPFFMPSFKQVLSDREIRTVLSYLKGVWRQQTKKPGAENKASPPDAAP